MQLMCLRHAPDVSLADIASAPWHRASPRSLSPILPSGSPSPILPGCQQSRATQLLPSSDPSPARSRSACALSVQVVPPPSLYSYHYYRLCFAPFAGRTAPRAPAARGRPGPRHADSDVPRPRAAARAARWPGARCSWRCWLLHVLQAPQRPYHQQGSSCPRRRQQAATAALPRRSARWPLPRRPSERHCRPDPSQAT